MDSLFGLEFSLPMKFFIAFAIVLILIGTAAYLLRRFGTGALTVTTQRNRQPRLAVVDSAPLDGRRKLVIVRRDNVEHLLMIGGPTDVVVEPNIVRVGVQVSRDTAIRTTSMEPMPLPDETSWPPAAANPRPEQPMMRPEAPAQVRPAAVNIPTTHVPPPQAPAPQPHVPLPPPTTAVPQQAVPPTMPRMAPQPQPPIQPVQIRPAVVQPAPVPAQPVGNIVETPRVQPPAAQQQPQPERVEAAAPSPIAPVPPVARAEAPAPAAPEPTVNEEQNLADMAHRLEAALRRPPPAPVPAPTPAPTLAAPAPSPAPMPAPAQSAPQVRPRPTPVVAPPPPPRPQAMSQENLAREMANLLGRQSGGT